MLRSFNRKGTGKPRYSRVASLIVTVATISWCGLGSTSAEAMSAAPGWAIQSIAQPTGFAEADNALCGGGQVILRCDTYQLLVTNVGGRNTAGMVTITDALPPGLKIANFEDVRTEVFSERESLSEWLEANAGTTRVVCTEPTAGTIDCAYGGAGEELPPGGELAVNIPVEVTTSASTTATNSPKVEGGGAATVTAAEPATVPTNLNGAPPAFGTQGFYVNAYAAGGATDLQAGDHPNQLVSGFNLNSFAGQYEQGNFPVAEAKDVVVNLPVGFNGDPQAAPTCSEADVGDAETSFSTGRTITPCPEASRVGDVTIEPSPPLANLVATARKVGFVTALYNVAPEDGYPAEFGFTFLGHPVMLFASVVPSHDGYRVRIESPGIARIGVKGVILDFFGDPNVQDGSGNAPAAFFANPAQCTSGPLKARIEADSWLEPGAWRGEEAVVYPGLTGCEMLQFNPRIEVAPETTTTDTPSGYEVTLRVPQTPNVFPNLATPDLKNAKVELPEGVTVSPSAADGLLGCPASGPSGIDLPHNAGGGEELHPNEAGEGEEIGPDGLARVAPGHCPEKSKIGEAEVETPLLARPLKGSVFVAQPACGGEAQPACTEASATNGELYGLYLEISGSGVIIKLHGTVHVNPANGHLITTFTEEPQLPFSELRLKLNGGPRAPLANPQTCGPATTTALLEPWGGPSASPQSPPFDVTGCAGPVAPFAPSFTAGTVVPDAGGFTPFTLTFSRHDGEQDLAGITVQMPPGLLGSVSGVPRCGEPQAREGTCSPESQIGTTTAAAGAGSHPFWLSGQVYLTGPYGGAPFGLSIVVPAKAGPFNLGNVVVRAAIEINPNTSALSVASEPLPQIRDGVPFRLQTVNVTIDRPKFILNPTNCSQQHIAATVTGSQGASASVSAPFAVTGCGGLPFKPSFEASTRAKTSRLDGASLTVKVAQKPGEANIRKVHLQFPKALPARLSTLSKACTAAQFDANPGGCPEGSVIGTGTAVTPILNVPLSGPAYLVSHGGAAYPDVVFVLQGQGVTIDLTGYTDIKKGVTYSNFETVPDAPVSSFEVTLPEGPHAVFGANLPVKARGSFCGRTPVIDTTLEGQNGAVLTQSTKIAATGCPRRRATGARKGRHAAKQRRGGRQGKK